MPQPNNAGDGCQGSPVRGAPQVRAEGPTLTAGAGVVRRVGLPAPRRERPCGLGDEENVDRAR